MNPTFHASSLLLIACSHVLAADFSGRLELKLDGAVAQWRDGKMGQPVHLDVYAECDQGRWRDVWAESDEFNRAIHLGEVTEATVSPATMRLQVKLALGSDNWIKGGPSGYELELKRDAKSGALTGTFAGGYVSLGGPFTNRGAVTGRLLPAVTVEQDFVPVQPGEHPRLLLRKSDLPALREKAKTPFGQAMVELLKQSTDPVALGLLYQLTGDRSYAERAKPATVKVMDNRDGGAFALGRFWGYRTSVVGAAYDLCYDAWELEFREQVENYLDWILYKCLHRQHRVGTVNWDPGSNYTIVIHAGNGMAALALWGERGAAPAEPLPPRNEAPRIAASADLKPAPGVPVVKLDPGRFPTEWLWIGPFEQRVLQHEHPFYDYKQPADCLASAGGMENVRPAPGDKVTFKQQTLEWKPLTKAANPDVFEGEFQHTGKTVLKCYKLANKRENQHLFFYTVLENDTPGWFQFDGNFYEGKCFIAGQRLLHGEHFFLEKGRFPLLVPSVMADGEFSCFFQFLPSSEEKARAFYADPARAAAFAVARQKHTEQLALWKSSGGANIQWLDHAERLRRWNYLNLRRGMGEGGFQGEGEGYTLECHHVIHDCACSYQNVFGRSVTGLADISHFAPRYLLTTVWSAPDRNGRERAFQQTYGRGRDTVSARYLARSMALCPTEWRPALLWHWLKLMGASCEDMISGTGVARAFGTDEFNEGLELAQAFINFPLDVKPVSPDTVMPRVWEAKTRGFYSFRNNWNDGPNSIVAQIYARDGQNCGWSQNEAGCFQIYGLGHHWARKLNDAVGKTGSRWHDNVVMLPEDPVNPSGRGRMTFYDADPKTGSGTVTFDMSRAYQCYREVGEGKDKKRELYDAGIVGTRAFAADYSGKCGAPALFAIADRIAGGGKKIWAMQLPPVDRDGPNYRLTIEGNCFVLAYKDASMKATFLSPRNVQITHAKGRMKAHPLSRIDDAEVNAIHATGANPAAGDFLVVLTLQQGPAPAVSVQNGAAKVGGRTVGFDGQKLTVD